MDIQTVRVKHWREISDYAKGGWLHPGDTPGGWLYRGQRNAAWDLKTSVERSCERRAVEPAGRREHEDALFREFRRSYHQYAAHVPDPNAVVEWLSLMQHHGAPTRLLDFNYSIYIASYFALEKAEEDCAVWAVRGPWALQESAKLLRAAGKPNVERMERPPTEGDDEVVQTLFLDEPYVAAAWPINAFRLNQRLRIQQGAFLIPGDISKPFMTNLETLPGHDSEKNVLKIIIPHEERQPALRNLFQMGISRTSLFPGLDGFSDSLSIYHPVVDDPTKWA
jgi:hypothetical protein